MAQTYYSRPYSTKWLFIIVGILSVSYIGLCITKGPTHPASHAAITALFIVTCGAILVDPETTYETRKVLDDGREVAVRRPLIGFKSQERLVGLTGGYEVRVDGWRYEEALIRI
ncbi:hypothetical protein BDV25DRAFT_138816 [Aspergillus avenaceus]|uniref:Uncharacterized protein n=1 Tax=Aspergillus avenaceus TaxID=36643 RepID=A0A5N6TYU4_ASPAV|nr:hypothetical protein BDV25DRAFT_138816 [Aspergillus avenaceus]